MTVSFDRSSATLVVNNPPGVFDPVVGIEPLHPIGSLSDFADDLRIAIDAIAGNKVFFACDTISATGTVNLTGAVGDNASNWELGFLQAQWVETNWGHYKADWTNGAAAPSQRHSRHARRDGVDPRVQPAGGRPRRAAADVGQLRGGGEKEERRVVYPSRRDGGAPLPADK
jgi:hypothetical protein